MSKKSPFSDELLESIYLSKVFFLFIDKKGSILASPTMTGFINSLDMNLWDNIQSSESREKALLKILNSFIKQDFECNLVEEDGYLILICQKKHNQKKAS